MKDKIGQQIQSSISISINDLDSALTFFIPTSLKKNDYFLQIGKKCNSVAFINTGILRIYYPNDLGEEVTCHFAQEGEWVTSLSVFGTHQPSKENIQCLTDCELLVIQVDDLDRMHKELPIMQEFSRKVIEAINVMMEKRVAFFQNYSAEHRYQYILKNHPQLLQTVPLQYLASYIGVTPQHLSRLRKMK